MTGPYRKIAFVWEEPQPPVSAPDRLLFHAYTEADRLVLANLLGRSMSRSLDRSDQENTSEHDPTEASLTLIDSVKEDFDYRPEWWQLAYNQRGALVGFVQPVIFRGGRRDDLEEGTIYYIGVAPEARGYGYAGDLLRKGTGFCKRSGYGASTAIPTS